MAKLVQLQFDWSTASCSWRDRGHSPAKTEVPDVGTNVDGDTDVASDPLHNCVQPLGGVESLAQRIALLLESDPRVVLNAHALAELAREYLHGSAGRGREMYDAAEAGMNIFLV